MNLNNKLISFPVTSRAKRQNAFSRLKEFLSEYFAKDAMWKIAFILLQSK